MQLKSHITIKIYVNKMHINTYKYSTMLNTPYSLTSVFYSLKLNANDSQHIR